MTVLTNSHDDPNRFEATRQQAVLTNPEGCDVKQLMTALNMLDD